MYTAIYSIIEGGKASHYFSKHGGLDAVPYLALWAAQEGYPDQKIDDTFPALEACDLYPGYAGGKMFEPISEMKLTAIRTRFGLESAAGKHIILDLDRNLATVIHNSACGAEPKQDYTVHLDEAADCLQAARQKAPPDSPDHVVALNLAMREKLAGIAGTADPDPLPQLDLDQAQKYSAAQRAIYTVIENGGRADFYAANQQDFDPIWALTEAVSNAREHSIGLIETIENMDRDGCIVRGLPVKDRLMERLDENTAAHLHAVFQTSFRIGSRFTFDFDNRRIAMEQLKDCFAHNVRNGAWPMPRTLCNYLDGIQEQSQQTGPSMDQL